MADEKSNAVELLKYPIIVFSILIALIIAKYVLGISFGPVSEVGPSGVKFAQDASAEIADLAGKLSGALVAIEELKKHSNSEEIGSHKIQTKIFEATQTVPDQTAQLAILSSNQAPGSPKQKGYIWIGDYKENKWSKVTLNAIDTGEPIAEPPEKLLPGTEYTAAINMVVRDAPPSRNWDSFRNRKSLGVIPKDMKILLLKKPVMVDREFAVQYWAEVELP